MDFTGEAALPISETALPATGNIIGTTYREDNSHGSQHMAISAVVDILAAILDYGEMIA